MKAANVFQIEQALDQPITPQQRQTAAANNPVAALIAQRLDGLENSFRTKMQTPPPPQGTVMNQYYQWPQQQQPNQMGLAQPGLEELAQQYAAGGLVAFAEGGYAEDPYYDVDGSEGYASGGDVRGHEYPWHIVGEGLDPSVIDEDTYKKIYEDLPSVGEGDRPPREWGAGETAGMSNDQPWPINPSAIQHPGFDKGRSYLSEAGDYIGDKFTSLRERIAKGEGKVKDAYMRALSEAEAEHDMPMMDYIKSLMPAKDEGDKLQDKINQKTEEHAARVADMEAPSKGKGQGMSTLQAQDFTPSNMPRGLPSMLAGYEDAPDVPRTQGLRQPGEAPVQPSTVVITDPEHRDTISRITSPEAGLSADQQIAALAKYFQTDTSEAMRIKGEMERDNAKANNLDMFAAMMGAIGLGIGTNAPRGQQWGAGLAGLASGLSGASRQADARQGKLDELALKIKEMEGSGTRKAAEMVLGARAKAAAEDAELKKALAVANIGRSGKVEAAQISAAGKGDSGELNRQKLRAEIIQDLTKDIPAEPNSEKWNTILNAKLKQYIANNPYAAELLTGVGGLGGSTGSSGTQRSMGSFVGGRFTPYG